jgi:hypothetical protein
MIEGTDGWSYLLLPAFDKTANFLAGILAAACAEAANPFKQTAAKASFAAT